METKDRIKSVIAGIALITLGTYIYSEWPNLIARLDHISVYALGIGSLLCVLYSAVTSLLTRISIALPINLWRAAHINSVSTLAGFMLPSGATPTRFILLREHLGLSISNSASSLLRTTNSGLIVNSVFALGLLFLLKIGSNQKANSELFFTSLLIFAALLFIANLALVLAPWVYARRHSFAPKILSKVQFSNAKQFMIMIGLTAMQTAIMALALNVYGVDLGSVSNFNVYLLLAAINGLTMVIAITPGNIGIREGIYALIASQLGFMVQDLIIISLIDRAVQLFSFTLISLFTFNLINRPLTDIKQK